MKVIGFTAKVGGGKDTAGALVTEILQEQGYKVTKLSFAKMLKDICTMMFGWDRQRLEHDFDYKEGYTLDDGTIDPACEMLSRDREDGMQITRRIVMQLMGTEAMRNGLHLDIWVIALELAIKRGEYAKYDYGLLTDCRFLNELNFVRRNGGKLVKIYRDGDATTLTDQTQHVSELEWEQWSAWDHEIRNHVDPSKTPEENLRAFKETLRTVVS